MRVIQLSDLDVHNPTSDQLLALIQARVVVWTNGNFKKFYYKYSVEGPISRGRDGEYYKVKVNGSIDQIEPTSPIVIIN